jgi:hypothetical protein
LLAGAVYELRWRPWVDDSEDANEFTAGSSPRTESPEVPRVLESTVRTAAPSAYGELWENYGEFTDSAVFVLESDGYWIVGDVRTKREWRRSRLDPWSDEVPAVSADDRVEVWGLFSPATVTVGSFAAMDSTGGLSEWSEPTDVAMPLAGCRTRRIHAVMFPVVLLPGACFVWFRRRTRDEEMASQNCA